MMKAEHNTLVEMNNLKNRFKSYKSYFICVVILHNSALHCFIIPFTTKEKIPFVEIFYLKS